MDIDEYVRFGRKWVLPALVLALVFGAVTYALTAIVVPKQYVATVTMEVQLGLPTSGTIDPNSATAYAATEAAIANQPNMVNAARVQAEGQVPASERSGGFDNVSCNSQGTTSLFSCSITSSSPVFAATMANTLAQVFIASENSWQQSRYAKVVRFLKKQIAKARQNGDASVLQVLEPIYPQIQLAAAQQSNLARLVTPATVPSSPAGPHPLLNAAIAFFLIFFVVLGAGRVVDAFDDSIRSEQDLRALTGLQVVGMIPTIRELRGKKPSWDTLVVRLRPRSRTAEAFRSARTGIAFATAGEGAYALMFSSAAGGAGTSTIAANVAIAFAEAGKSVVLLDLDLRHRSITTIFHAPKAGLADLLIDENRDLAEVLVPSSIPNLRILPTGSLPPNPSQFIGSPRMERIMLQLKSSADLIVVDGPPMLTVADAAVVAALCDYVILVVQAERSKRQSVRRAIQMLQTAGVLVAGLVVNSYDRWGASRLVEDLASDGEWDNKSQEAAAHPDMMDSGTEDIAAPASGRGRM